MASPVSLHQPPAVSSQPADSPAVNFPQVVSQASTPGFRPSIPPKNSRVPAGEIDRLSSSSNISNQLNRKVATGGTPTTPGAAQALAPPPFPLPPIKGINNTQARTARKSAPSSSNRGDGYSTSSSGGGGRKSISSSSSGKNGRERKDRESLSISESPNESPISGSAGVEGLNHKRSLQLHTTLPILFKPQPQQHTQPMQQESQPLIQANTQKQQQQKEVMVPAIPPPPAFGGPPAQTAGAKRPASPTFLSSSKPKRVKNPTAKAAALANEPLMNADGSAVKKRKPKGLPEKEKPRKGKSRGLIGLGVFALGDNHDAGSGGTISVAKPVNTLQRLPNPPPPYQVPVHLQKQSTAQGQQEKNNSSAPLSAASNLLVGRLQESQIPAFGCTSKSQNSFVSTSSIQTPQRQKSADVITISSSPTDPRAETRNQGESDCRLRLGQREQGKSQSTPITIDDIVSGGEDNTIRPPEEMDQGGEDDNSKIQNNLNHDLTTDDERKRVLDGIIGIIRELFKEADNTHLFPQVQETETYFQNEHSSSTLQAQMVEWLAHVNVLTDEGKVISFNEWKVSGKMKFKGEFTLSDIWKAKLDTKVPGGETKKPEEPQPPKELVGLEVDDASSTQGSTISSAGTTPNSSVSGTISCDSVPDHKAQEEVTESRSDEEQMEEVVFTNVSQPVDAVSPPLESPTSLPPEEPAITLQAVATQPQEKEKPQEKEMPQERQKSQGKQKPEEEERPLEKQKQSSPSNQIQAEADASAVDSNFVPAEPEVQAPTVSGKRKRKTFAAPTAQEFLNESRSRQELRSQRVSSFNMRQQERNDPLLLRIAELNKEELSVRDKIDAIAAESRTKEVDFGKRIADARSGAGAKIDGTGGSNTELGLTKNVTESPINWEEYRKIIRELRDFQEDTRHEELRLIDRATRIVEEKKYLTERRKRMRQMQGGLETTSSRTSEERSVDTGSTAPTTAPSSVADSLDENQSIPPPVGMNAQPGFPEISIGEELLRSLIPWAKQLQEVSTETSPSLPTEATTDQVRPKKKAIRRKKHW